MLKIHKLMQNERIIDSQTSDKMSSRKNRLNNFGILFHLILMGVAIFKTNSQAATPFEQVEEAVGGGAIYLDLVGVVCARICYLIFWPQSSTCGHCL